MALTKRAALAMATTLLLVAGCSGDDEPAAGESPTANSTPIDSGPPTEPGVTAAPTGDQSTPSSTPTESETHSSGHVDNCALGATVIRAKIPRAQAEQDPPEPGSPKDGTCIWNGPARELLTVTTDKPSEFTQLNDAKKRAGPGTEFRPLPELGRDAWFSKGSTLTVEFKTAALRINLDAARIDESAFLAIAEAVHTDARKVN